jgi:hypothetical protein
MERAGKTMTKDKDQGDMGKRILRLVQALNRLTYGDKENSENCVPWFQKFYSS